MRGVAGKRDRSYPRADRLQSNVGGMEGVIVLLNERVHDSEHFTGEFDLAFFDWDVTRPAKSKIRRSRSNVIVTVAAGVKIWGQSKRSIESWAMDCSICPGSLKIRLHKHRPASAFESQRRVRMGVVNIQAQGETDLMQVAFTLGGSSLHFRARQCWKQHRSEKRYNCDHNEKFDKRERKA